MTRPCLALLLALAASTATPLSAQPPGGKVSKEPASAAAYRALAGEYDAAVRKFQKASDAAEGAEAKRKVFQELHPRREDYLPRFVALAERYPGSAAAVDALAWVVRHPVTPGSPEAGLRGKALRLLPRDHPRDERLGALCTALVDTIDADSEAFLREVLRKGVYPGVKARACASLAHNLKYRARIVRQIRDDAEAKKTWAQSWGQPAVDHLFKRSADDLAKESIALFERVAKSYPDVPHPTHLDLRRFAQAHLLSLQKPIDVDKPAPEISRSDLEGKPLKLSDHRGKVVLLLFWGHQLPTCPPAYAPLRKLAKRQEGRPFVILGVNADTDRDAAQKVARAEKLPWRSWWDRGPDGPLASRWEIDVYPTAVLIDHKGVVRELFYGLAQAKELGAAIERLVKAAAGAGS